jgi:hypothetical protein
MTEASQPAAKTDPVPPPTGLKAAWKHLQNWAEVYFWVPLALLSIYLLSEFAYLLTGRKPQENADWLVGLGGNLVKCMSLIMVVSVLNQQNGVWLTKEELIANPHLSRDQMVSKCVSLIVFGYLLAH